MHLHRSFAFQILYLAGHTFAQESNFSACPLLGPRFPIPQSTASSPIVQSGLQNLTATLDTFLTAGDGEYGPISANTTSFSLALFSTEQFNSSKPFFYEYHHTSSSLKTITQGVKEVDADTVYRVGDLTTLFTTYLFLKEAGEDYWDEPVTKYVPELSAYLPTSGSGKVSWDKITLGDLAAHLGGIGRYSPQSTEVDTELASFLSIQAISSNNKTSPCSTDASKCTRSEFLSYFGHTAHPVFTPASTPIFSNAGYIVLAYALETITGKSYDELLQLSLLDELSLSHTTLLSAPINTSIIPSTNASGFESAIAVEASFNGIYSTLTDISALIRSIVNSTSLTQETTNRWLKPVSHTSNRANSVGRPWEIYSLITSGPEPIIAIYQVRGNVGFYSSHIGVVSDYGVGFAILGADSEQNPDLNALADIIATEMIPALEKNALVQASQTLAGTYTASTSNTNETVELRIDAATDATPGLGVSAFGSNSTDLFAVYGRLLSVEAANLSFRLYPTDLVEQGNSMGTMRAVFQDKTALADAGTPTCDTWRDVDELQVNGVGMDEFKFSSANGGEVVVEVVALGLKLVKKA